MAQISTCIVMLLLVSACVTTRSAQKDSLAYQKELNAQYADPETSPLTAEDLRSFDGLEFFPYSEKYNVMADIVPVPDSKPFQMATSTDRKPIYQERAMAIFTIDEKKDTLHMYENIKYSVADAKEIQLFVPYTDLTTGVESYGGGRYLDVQYRPGIDSLRIDFNKSYNPYCAYNDLYSCPVPPRENALKFAVKAGVKAPKGH